MSLSGCTIPISASNLRQCVNIKWPFRPAQFLLLFVVSYCNLWVNKDEWMNEWNVCGGKSSVAAYKNLQAVSRCEDVSLTDDARSTPGVINTSKLDQHQALPWPGVLSRFVAADNSRLYEKWLDRWYTAREVIWRWFLGNCQHRQKHSVIFVFLFDLDYFLILFL